MIVLNEMVLVLVIESPTQSITSASTVLRTEYEYEQEYEHELSNSTQRCEPAPIDALARSFRPNR